MNRILIILANCLLLLSGCADNASLPYYTADGRPALAPCADTDAFAAWQCQRFYAKQRINGYCRTVPGGEMGIRQCQQYYTKLAEAPPPTPTPSGASSLPPSPSPTITAPQSNTVAVAKYGRRETIYVGGTITQDENEDFARRTAALSNPLVVLSGPGGNTLAAIRIGQFVRLRGWDTLVPEGQFCMSACALAWLGGAHRYMGQTSKIGFHASYRVVEGKAIESGVGNAVVGAYLNSLGLPERIVVYVTMSASDDLLLLTIGDANALGIRVSMLGR